MKKFNGEFEKVIIQKNSIKVLRLVITCNAKISIGPSDSPMTSIEISGSDLIGTLKSELDGKDILRLRVDYGLGISSETISVELKVPPEFSLDLDCKATAEVEVKSGVVIKGLNVDPIGQKLVLTNRGNIRSINGLILGSFFLLSFGELGDIDHLIVDRDSRIYATKLEAKKMKISAKSDLFLTVENAQVSDKIEILCDGEAVISLVTCNTDHYWLNGSQVNLKR